MRKIRIALAATAAGLLVLLAAGTATAATSDSFEIGSYEVGSSALDGQTW